MLAPDFFVQAENAARMWPIGGEMKFYEAKPGMWLVVGVSIEEHEAAVAENYSPGMDEYLEQRYNEAFKEAHRRACDEWLLDRDLLHEWKTGKGEILKLNEMEDSHVANAVRFLQRHYVDVYNVTPNLVCEYQRRFGERP